MRSLEKSERSVQSLIEILQQDHYPMDTVQTITCFNFQGDPSKKKSQFFFTGGWDGILRAYKLDGKHVKQICLIYEWQFYHPIISLDMKINGTAILVGLGNGQIFIVDIQNISQKKIAAVGYHNNPICNAFWLKNEENIILSFGFDKQIKVWSEKDKKVVSEENLSQGKIYQMVPLSIYLLPFKTMNVSYNHPNIAIASLKSRIFLFNCQSFGNQVFSQQLSKITEQSYHKLKKFGELSKIICTAIEDNYCAVGGADGTVCIFSIRRNSGNPNVSLTQKFVELSPQNQRIIITQKKGKSSGQVNSLQFGYIQGKAFLIVGGTYYITYYNIETLESQIQSLKNTTQNILVDIGNKLGAKNKNKKQEIIACCTKIKWWSIQSSVIVATGNDWSLGLNSLEKNPKKPKLFIRRIKEIDMQSLAEKRY